ncbi:hypothetical protein SCB49_14285 [unidentified eubacterium SCB49]|nr:hypothetical protein SCB49_14285 [unidentified eubacterium SCB49]
MKKIVIILILFCSVTLSAQNDYCFYFTETIKIENEIDIPSITDNGDGTVTLTHPNQDITDLFASYIIYGLTQSYPNSTDEEYLKYYTLTHSSKGLIEMIKTTISENIYLINSDYTSEFPFYSGFIDFIDGKEYIYSAIGQSSSEGGNCDNIFTCELDSITNDTNLSVLFTYDAASETLYLETESPSSCGNEFRIGFKPGINQSNGGSSQGQMQEWSIDNVVVSQGDTNDTCFWLESFLYNMLGVGCERDTYYGNISMYYSPEVEKIRFFRENVLFFTGILEFRDPNLSINESPLDIISVYETKDNPFLQVVNKENLNVTIQLFDVNGRVVVENQELIDNVINISILPQALYLIELTDATGNKEIVKFLKR